MGKQDKITISGFADALADVLAEYGYVAAATVNECIHETAEETAADVRSGAPERTGVYGNSWTSGYEKQRGSMYSETVYADKDGYRLAHLLEHGHASRNGGRVRAIPHIAPVEQVAPEKLMAKLRARLEG